MLEHIGGEREIGHAVREGEEVAVTGDRRALCPDPGPHGHPVPFGLRRVLGVLGRERPFDQCLGLDQDAAGPGLPEGLGEESPAATDVEDGLARQVGVPLDLGPRVERDAAVEGVGIGLLEAEHPGETDGAGQSLRRHLGQRPGAIVRGGRRHGLEA